MAKQWECPQQDGPDQPKRRYWECPHAVELEKSITDPTRCRHLPSTRKVPFDLCSRGMHLDIDEADERFDEIEKKVKALEERLAFVNLSLMRQGLAVAEREAP